MPALGERAVFAVIRDLTRQKRAEAELRAARDDDDARAPGFGPSPSAALAAPSSRAALRSCLKKVRILSIFGASSPRGSQACSMSSQYWRQPE